MTPAGVKKACSEVLRMKNEIQDINMVLNDYETSSTISEGYITYCNMFKDKDQMVLSKCDKEIPVSDKVQALIKRKRVLELIINRIENALNVLDDFEREVITKIYFEGKQIRATALDMTVSASNLTKVRDRSYKKMSEVLFQEIEYLPYWKI